MKARRLAALTAAAVLALPAAAAALLVLPGSAAAAELQLVLPLRSDQRGLTRLADAVSDPGSPQYRHYATVAWLSRHFGATPETRSAVTRYLRARGAAHVQVDATGQYVYAEVSTAEAERLFSVDLVSTRGPHDVGFTEPRSRVILPSGLRGRVTGVIGLDTEPLASASLAATAPSLSDPLPAPFGADASAADDPPGPTPAAPTVTTTSTTTATTTTPTTTAPTSTTPISSGTSTTPGIPSGYPGADSTATPAGCGPGVATQGFTPNEYLDAYDYAPLQQSGLLGQGERVALIEIDGFNSSDVDAFASCFGLSVPPIQSFGVGQVHEALPPGGEATLDLEVMDAAAPDLKAIDVYETEPDASSVLRAIAQPLQTAKDLPDVISVSLGLCESQTLAGAGRAVVNASETALKVAAAAGVSVLSASGDFGSAGCSSLTDTAQATPEPQLAVNFPASSPWVTAVGGTNITLGPQNLITSQAVWNDGSVVPGEAGGGGVSILFSRPTWQASVVTGTARALPDVGLLADVAPGYAVYCTAESECRGAGWQSFGGTSAATPLLAGGFALIDQALRESGRQALGLADPLLYQLGEDPTSAAQVFYDVTVGSNDVGPFIQPSDQPLGCCSATVGYDEASGWGGVNLQALEQASLTDVPVLAEVAIKPLHAQSAAATDGIYARVTCSSACDMSAYARVTVTGARTFTDYAKLTPVGAAGTRRLKVVFTTAQAHAISAALQRGGHASAVVVGTVLDAAGDILRHTTPHRIQIIG